MSKLLESLGYYLIHKFGSKGATFTVLPGQVVKQCKEPSNDRLERAWIAAVSTNASKDQRMPRKPQLYNRKPPFEVIKVHDKAVIEHTKDIMEQKIAIKNQEIRKKAINILLNNAPGA